ncbi:MAG: glycosyltransferase family 4 protein [Acidiferrobacteraceae bacterium]
MNNLITLFTALAVSMAIIPVMMRLAPHLGMIDLPDARKVHSQPVPRVGGVGIVIGALLPIVLWAPATSAIHAYLFGSLVLLAFGVCDDCRELGHYTKFIGQLIAVLWVVYYGGLYVSVLPFIHQIPGSIGKPFTVFAMVGMINAINHSDGLDGLAGGLSILSLICIAYLGFRAHSDAVLAVSTATMGGVLGFLRYNTYPAMVFMGDGGSQFLGFTLAFLVILLTQDANPTLSHAIPALILGLPIIDILAVLGQRVHHRMNWFRATKNHIHHRLLDLGFDHYEAVVIIYSIQTLLVVSAIALRYSADILILSLYLGVCAGLFAFLILAKRRGWRAHKRHSVSRLMKAINIIRSHQWLQSVPIYIIATGIPSLFLFVAITAVRIPYEFSVDAVVLTVVLLTDLLWAKGRNSLVSRAVSYVTAAFTIYLGTKYGFWPAPLSHMIDIGYFTLLAAAVGFAIRYIADNQFQTTPMDYLVIVIVLVAGLLLRGNPQQAELSAMAVKLVIVFYGCEIAFTRMKMRWNPISISALITLVVLGMRGLA